MPRAKYIKPPGPFPSIEKIQRSKFQFRTDQWRKLTQLLPPALAERGVPRQAADDQWRAFTSAALPERVKTIADFLILMTEHMIKSHLTASPIPEASMNPANVRSAIRRLRAALKPFFSGWVDTETGGIIPRDLDANLAAREQEIAKLRIPPAKQRALAMLCEHIEILVRHWACANDEKLDEQEMLRYVDAVLNFAGIAHPNITKHRKRLAALVFPKDTQPHSKG